eukprot:m51a1_g9232 hypothetical protein (308) ;mRNA; f:81108-82272
MSNTRATAQVRFARAPGASPFEPVVMPLEVPGDTEVTSTMLEVPRSPRATLTVENFLRYYVPPPAPAAMRVGAPPSPMEAPAGVAVALDCIAPWDIAAAADSMPVTSPSEDTAALQIDTQTILPSAETGLIYYVGPAVGRVTSFFPKVPAAQPAVLPRLMPNTHTSAHSVQALSITASADDIFCNIAIRRPTTGMPGEQRGLAMVIGDVRTSEPADIITAMSTPTSSIFHHRRVQQQLGQRLFEQDCDMRYFALTTYETWWFMKLDGSTLRVSSPFPRASTRPTVCKLLYWAIDQALVRNVVSNGYN